LQSIKPESNSFKELVNSNRLSLIYDGDCPFCSAYVKFTHLKKQVGQIDLINARNADPTLLLDLANQGYDLNNGMLMIYGGTCYFGADCMHMLALLSSKSDFFNRCCAVVFKNHKATKILYPILRTGRNLTLRILGKKKI